MHLILRQKKIVFLQSFNFTTLLFWQFYEKTRTHENKGTANIIRFTVYVNTTFVYYWSNLKQNIDQENYW